MALHTSFRRWCASPTRQGLDCGLPQWSRTDGRSVAHVNDWREAECLSRWQEGSGGFEPSGEDVAHAPSPRTNGYPGERRRNTPCLETRVKIYPTPGGSRSERSPTNSRGGWPDEIGGSLNPTWVEWLMGFPLGWTALEALATPSSRKSRKSSGGRSCRTAVRDGPFHAHRGRDGGAAGARDSQWRHRSG